MVLLLTVISFTCAGWWGPPELREHRMGDEVYVSLKSVSAVTGLKLKKYDKTIRLANSQYRFQFKQGSRKLKCGEALVWMHRPIKRVNRKWCISEVDWQTCVQPVIEANAPPYDHRPVVVLDPGHGGKDDGSTGAQSSKEKKLTLDLCRKVRTALSDAGCKVYLTREKDVYLPLVERCRKAARWKADVLVSIHLNSAGNKKAAGVETYVLCAPGYPSSLEKQGDAGSEEVYAGHAYAAANMGLAFAVHEQLLRDVGMNDRGIKRARFVVLREAPCMAVLIECGFLSNPEEEARLKKEPYREKVATAIAGGIQSTLQRNQQVGGAL